VGIGTLTPFHAVILPVLISYWLQGRKPVWNLDTVHKLSELLAALAVVVSLVFVGLEVRQNTTAVQSSAAQSVHDNFATWYSSIQGDGELLEITTRGMQNYGSLNSTEKGQFIAVFMSFSSHTQNAFYKWKEGSLTPELWRAWELVSMNFFSTPGGKAFWSERGYMFADAFQDYIGLDLMARKPHEKAKPWGAFELSNADRPGAEARQ